jgi:hypothetical protein
MKTVVTADTQRDITQILTLAAAHHGFDPIFLLGGAIAESGLREQAARERDWPDVSYGLWQPAVAFLGTEIPGLTRGGNGRVEDTAGNRQTAREYCFDAAKLAEYVAPRYAALLARFREPLEAWCRWNAPAIPGSENPHRRTYVEGLAAAEVFRDAGGTADVDEVGTMSFPEEVQLTTSMAPNRPQTLGVFIHSTRGGHDVTLEQEFRATIGFFFNPANEVSAHYVVGPSKVCRMVRDEDTAFHARENNRTHLGVEIAQPFISTPYTEFQYQAAAFLVRRWCDKFGIPMERVMTQSKKGLIGHEDSEQGKRDGKSDPGPKFDWDHFLALVRGRQPGPADPAVEARIAELINALGFVTGDVANGLHRNLDRATAATTADERTAAQQGIQSGIDMLRANGLAASDGGAVKEHNPDVVNALGFVTVDVADALQRALDGARAADSDAARTPAYQALQAAINTLRAQHP